MSLMKVFNSTTNLNMSAYILILVILKDIKLNPNFILKLFKSHF